MLLGVSGVQLPRLVFSVPVRWLVVLVPRGTPPLERDRLRPISTSASFFFRATSANFDFGQFGLRPIRFRPASFFERLRPISTSANLDFGQFDFGQFLGVEFLDDEVWGPRRVGPQTKKKWSPEGWSPEGWSPEGWSPEGWSPEGAPKGGRPKISRFFFPRPPQFSFFFLSLGVFSWNFGGV